MGVGGACESDIGENGAAEGERVEVIGVGTGVGTVPFPLVLIVSKGREVEEEVPTWLVVEELSLVASGVVLISID